MGEKELECRIERNDNGELYGKTKCKICSNVFDFQENKNSKALAIGLEDIYVNNHKKLFIRLNMISKCPYCGYNIEHYQIEENEKLDKF